MIAEMGLLAAAITIVVGLMVALAAAGKLGATMLPERGDESTSKAMWIVAVSIVSAFVIGTLILTIIDTTDDIDTDFSEQSDQIPDPESQ